jgi:hypothetical protein
MSALFSDFPDHALHGLVIVRQQDAPAPLAFFRFGHRALQKMIAVDPVNRN